MRQIEVRSLTGIILPKTPKTTTIRLTEYTASNPYLQRWRIGLIQGSHEHPFTAPLDELIEQYSKICKDETTNIESEEFRSVPRAKLKTNLSLIRVF